eukprot:28400-Chlamydomonas_euryale.AAC.2
MRRATRAASVLLLQAWRSGTGSEPSSSIYRRAEGGASRRPQKGRRQGGGRSWGKGVAVRPVPWIPFCQLHTCAPLTSNSHCLGKCSCMHSLHTSLSYDGPL